MRPFLRAFDKILKCLSNSVFSRTLASRWKGKLSCWCFFSRWIWTQILCSSDPECSSRVQISQPDPQMSSGALIHVPHYLSNLRFRVWKKMQETLHHSESLEDVKSLYTLCTSNNHYEVEVNFNYRLFHKIIPQIHDDYKAQSILRGVSLCIRFVFLIYKKKYSLIDCILFAAPLTLDPNTAHPHLTLSADLTSVSNSDVGQNLPGNPERFDMYACVLGSEGFNSGTHCWDVEVGDNTRWILGITTSSNQRKGGVFFNTNVWRVRYMNSKYSSKSPDQPFTLLTVKEQLQRVRVQLDCERGKVSFSDPRTNICLCSFTTTFTETVFPFLYNHCTASPLSILPVKLIVTTENHS